MTKNDAGFDGGAWAVLTGAIIGAVAGYVVGTSNGRRLYNNAVQILEDFSEEWPRFMQTASRAQSAAVDSWKAISSMRGPRMEPDDRVVG
jgi:hypothetical protein